jgi:four helix bundle protein
MLVYRDLEIYKESKQLAIAVHNMSLTLPKFELYETGGQIRRSAKSVKTMIVEGYGRRRYKADLVKHLVISISECDETIDHLDTLYDTKSLTDSELYHKLRESYVALTKKINKYTQWVEEHYVWRPPKKSHQPN